MRPQPGEVSDFGLGGRNDQKAILGQSRHGQVGLDAATLVEPLRINQPAGRQVDIVRGDAVQDTECITTFESKLGE